MRCGPRTVVGTIVVLLSVFSVFGGCGQLLGPASDNPPTRAPDDGATGEDGAATTLADAGSSDADESDADAGGFCIGKPCASRHCQLGLCEPLVFISIGKFLGSFAELVVGDPGDAADLLCQDEGNTLWKGAGTPRFRAWLGGPKGPTDRGVNLVGRPFWTPASDGGTERVAVTSDALSSVLEARIARRDGMAVDASVWTDVTATGSVFTDVKDTCNGWTASFGQTGAIGDPSSGVAGRWAAGLSTPRADCGLRHPIYCFEVVDP